MAARGELRERFFRPRDTVSRKKKTSRDSVKVSLSLPFALSATLPRAAPREKKSLHIYAFLHEGFSLILLRDARASVLSRDAELL